MYYKKCGQKNKKFRMLCLMMKIEHPGVCANASAYKGDNKENPLRDPPAVVDCLVFIYSHKDKSENIS